MKKKFYTFLSIVLMLLMQTSCVYDKESNVECNHDESLILNINISVPSSSTGTRSADDELEAGTAAENYLNVANGDYKICVFDKEGNYVGDDILSDIECVSNGIRNGEVSYTLTAKLDLSSNADRERLSKFKVMVLANWKSFERSNTQTSYEYPSFNYSLSAIFHDKDKFNFTLNDPSNHSSWVPGGNKSIPMFGISDELDLQSVIEMAKYGDGACFSISMLRALAKVEIIDEGIEKIGSVSMSNVNKFGRFIPEIDETTNTDWNGDAQIETPSLPTNAGNIDKIEFVKGPETSDGKSTWVAYIPEMDLSQKRPDITIYDSTTPLTIPFNNYGEDGQVVTDEDGFLPYVLRNHIYRFKVTITDKAKLSIKLTVLPWDMEYDETPSYFDSPKVTEYLTWTTKELENPDYEEKDEEPKYKDNGYKDDPQNLELTMKPGVDEFAEATFTLEAPKNCRWYAQLVTLDGKGDAFYFADENGNAITENNGNPYGIIDGSKCTIRIKNKTETVSDRNNEARLVIMVEYPDKSNREVKVAVIKDDEGEIVSWGNYTIIQEQTDIYGS